jgi:hypothetical protein
MTTDHESPDDLLDAEAASEVLGVPVDRVQVMVEEGLLTPQGPADEPRFVRAELMAVRELGG